jgi:alanine racemase
MSHIPPRSTALVSLRRIAQNYRSICEAVGPDVEVAPVVKANAYGHGAVPVARHLVEQGVRTFAVATIAEGLELRGAGIAATLLIMGGVLPGEEAAAVECRLTPVLHSLDDIRRFENIARRSAVPAGFHLKIDTGMGRLGVRAEAAEILPVLQSLRFARLDGLMTHFASAPSSEQTDDQVRVWLGLLQGLRNTGIQPVTIHASSSAAIAYGRREAWLNLVRPGISLYGYCPRDGGAAAGIDVAPALVWKARLITVKEVPEGALIGYGGTFRAPGRMRIGVVAAGYADGVFRNLSNRGMVIAAGKPARMLGIVSMDVTTVDLTEAPALRAGDEVTLLGTEGDASIDAADIADWAGTIPYDVLCRVGTRVLRVYV